MENSKRGFLPLKHGIKLSKKQSPKTDEELKRISDIPYASAVGSIQYVVQCIGPDVAFALSITVDIRRVTGRHTGVQSRPLSKSEYIVASKAAKEVVWMKNYIQELAVVPNIAEPFFIFCDNNRAIAQAKEPRSHHRSNHILRRYHLLREMVSRGDVRMDRVSSTENIEDSLTKLVSQIAHTQHLDKIGLRSMGDWL
ncbi:UNVERIFIED_CONTAM: hypothetical protein Slati_0489800 [Sesamum latifolium]|uniref:Uncharacterized protein n=1 Tax=Sesamum latifolium TaxID=2727402 RepID=A0AAW2Y008_9LAMI